MSDAPYKAVEFILTHAEKYAKAKASRVYLEEFRKTKKALLMKDALGQGFESLGAQEREAYANEAYEGVLQGLQAAIEVEETLRWQLEAARLKTDIWRTQSANDRSMDKATI